MKIKKSNFFEEFQKFITRGNMVDLAVGVIIGGAFTAIVNSLVNDVFTPFINFVIFVLCGKDINKFSGLDLTLIPASYDASGNLVNEATVLSLSSFLSAVLNFLLIGLVLFLIVKGINKLRDKMDEKVKKIEDKIVEKDENEENK